MGQAIKSGEYEGTLPLKGRARVLSWSELVSFFLDLETTDKLQFTAWFEVNTTFGSKGISRLIRVKSRGEAICLGYFKWSYFEEFVML